MGPSSHLQKRLSLNMPSHLIPLTIGQSSSPLLRQRSRLSYWNLSSLETHSPFGASVNRCTLKANCIGIRTRDLRFCPLAQFPCLHLLDLWSACYKKLPIHLFFSDLLVSDKSVSLQLKKSWAGHGTSFFLALTPYFFINPKLWLYWAVCLR